MSAGVVAFLKYLDARMGEPSTWASMAVLLGALHFNVSSDTWAAITAWGVIFSGLLGIALSEKAAGKGTAQIAQDILNTLITLTNKKDPKA
jgi:hypothetical protein